MSGPLDGMRVVEIGSIGPGPFCAMVLSDLGAEVIRVERLEANAGAFAASPRYQPMLRGRRSIRIDLKHPDGPSVVLGLVEKADVLIEGFRPGVAERLGLGPEACAARNPGLVYGRMTGYGQDGPLAGRAGHDIDYLAIAGVLHGIGPGDGRPMPPLNLVGDFGGGGMLLAVGVLAALWERERSGLGQVIDASMVEGSALLGAMFHGLRAAGLWTDRRADNLLDGGAPFYDTYETADGRFVAVGAIEPKFYAALIDGLGLSAADLPSQYDAAGWPRLRSAFAEVFTSRTRDQWSDAFAGSDACVAPVLDMGEAAGHPHNSRRGTFVAIDGVVQPAPAPRFARTPSSPPTPPVHPGADTHAILTEAGNDDAAIVRLRSDGVVG